ncbi:hypothetical protein ROZALSC1DRAFT_28516 [Rozella allomycis CSF55]|uniref:Cache domain-containing protein n=1 Tax=Rozella allomycis (strain CSF55) TaxID=988480 RepID=A0A4P9YKF3_ROZAC|nr:hypothetical protein ROZALSC1DRAFT_28516 [Rozella allomycis CSF55]
MNDKRSVLTKLFPQLSFNVENVITQTFTTNAGELWGFYTYLERRNDYKSRKYSMWEHYGLNYTEYDVDKELNILNINYQSNQLNYTDGTWVLMVNKSNEADIAWSTVYVWQEIAWLTNSVPIYDNSSECIGVCSTDMDLHFINSILSARIRSVKQPTVLYVIESSAEFVIGTSHDNTDMFYRDPILNISTRPFTAREKSNIEIGSFDTLIKSKGFNFTTLPDDYTDTCFDVKSNTYFYVTTKKIKWRNFEWTVVQFLEKSSVYLTINKATVDSLISVAITVCVSILVGFVFSHWISRDIKRITSDLKKLAEFHFSSVYKGRNNSVNTSNVKEIFEIQSAFHSMVTAFAKTLATNQSLLKGSVISSPTSLGATELNE